MRLKRGEIVFNAAGMPVGIVTRVSANEFVSRRSGLFQVGSTPKALDQVTVTAETGAGTVIFTAGKLAVVEIGALQPAAAPSAAPGVEER